MSPLEEALDAPSPQGLSDLGGSWDRGIDRALELLLGGAPVPPVAELSQDRGWALLSWAECMASQITRARDASLLERAVFALLLVDRSGVLDRRDTLVVGGLLRR